MANREAGRWRTRSSSCREPPHHFPVDGAEVGVDLLRADGQRARGPHRLRRAVLPLLLLRTRPAIHRVTARPCPTARRRRCWPRSRRPRSSGPCSSRTWPTTQPSCWVPTCCSASTTASCPRSGSDRAVPGATLARLQRRRERLGTPRRGGAHRRVAGPAEGGAGRQRPVSQHRGGGGGLVRPHGPSLRPRRPDLGARDAPRVGPLGRLARLHRALHRLQRAARPAAPTDARPSPACTRPTRQRSPSTAGWWPTPSARLPRTSARLSRREYAREVLDHLARVVLDAVDERGLASPQHGQPERVQTRAVDHAALVAQVTLRVDAPARRARCSRAGSRSPRRPR